MWAFAELVASVGELAHKIVLPEAEGQPVSGWDGTEARWMWHAVRPLDDGHGHVQVSVVLEPDAFDTGGTGTVSVWGQAWLDGDPEATWSHRFWSLVVTHPVTREELLDALQTLLPQAWHASEKQLSSLREATAARNRAITEIMAKYGPQP